MHHSEYSHEAQSIRDIQEKHSPHQMTDRQQLQMHYSQENAHHSVFMCERNEENRASIHSANAHAAQSILDDREKRNSHHLTFRQYDQKMHPQNDTMSSSQKIAERTSPVMKILEVMFQVL